MATQTEVKLKLTGDNKDAKKSIDELSKESDKLDKQISGMNTTIKIDGDASGAISEADNASDAVEEVPEETEVEIDGDASGAVDGAEDAESAVDSVPDEVEVEFTADTSNVEEATEGLIGLAASVGTAISAKLGSDMFLDLSSEIDDMAKYSASMNILTQDYIGLQRVSTLYGLSEQDLQKLLTKNQNAVTEATLGNSKFSDMYDRLGVSIYDASGNVKDSTQILEETTVALGDVKDGAEQQMIANELFGKSYTSVNKILDGGVDAFWEQGEVFAENTTLTEENSQAYEKMNDSMAMVQNVIQDLKAKALLPLTGVITSLSEIAIAGLTGNTDDLTGKQKILLTAFKVLLPIIGAIAGILAVYAIGLGIVTIATTAWGIASTIAGGALAVLTSPITLVVGGIILLVGAVVLILKKLGLFEPVMEAVKLTFEAFIAIIKKVISIILKTLQPVIEGFGKLWKEFSEGMTKAFNKFKEYFADDIKAIKDIFAKYIEFLKAIISGDFSKAWELAKEILGKLKEVYISIITKLYTWLGEIIVKLWEMIKTKWNELWDKAKQYVKDKIDAMVSYIKSIPTRMGETISKLGELIKSKWNETWTKFKDLAKEKIDSVVTLMKSLPSRIASAISSFASALSNGWSNAWSSFKKIPVNALNSVISGVESGMNSVISGAVSGLNKLISAGNKIPGVNISEVSAGGISLPRVPYFAKGGIVDGAGLGVVGEAGPEMILPLNGQGANFLQKAFGNMEMGQGGNTVNINIDGDMVAINPEQMQNNILNKVDEYLGGKYA